MATAAIHVVPDDSFDDWVVRGDVGQEFGHFSTREEAELAAQAIAQGCSQYMLAVSVAN